MTENANPQHPVQYSYRDAQGRLLFERTADGSLNVYDPSNGTIYSRRGANGDLTVYNVVEEIIIGDNSDLYPNGKPIRENVDGNEIIYGPDGQKLLTLNGSTATYFGNDGNSAGVTVANVRTIEMSTSGCKLTTKDNAVSEYVIDDQSNAPYLLKETDANGNITAYDKEKNEVFKTRKNEDGELIIDVYRKDGTLMSSTNYKTGIKTVYDETGQTPLYEINTAGIVKQMQQDGAADQRQADGQGRDNQPSRGKKRRGRQEQQTSNETNFVSKTVVQRWSYPRNGGR